LHYPNGSVLTEIGTNDWGHQVPSQEFNLVAATWNKRIGHAVGKWLWCMRRKAGTGCYRHRAKARNLTVQFYPTGKRMTGTHNAYHSFLRPVECGRRTRVDFLSSKYWGVMKPVAERLVALQHQGCRVSVVVTSVNTSSRIIKIFRKAGVRLRFAGGSNIQSAGGQHNHAKMVLVRGRYKGKRQCVMLTGSANMALSTYSDNDMIRMTGLSRHNCGSAAGLVRAIWRVAKRQPGA
jgi:hypothetical protein